jgi:hypothetical protein
MLDGTQVAGAFPYAPFLPAPTMFFEARSVTRSPWAYCSGQAGRPVNPRNETHKAFLFLFVLGFFFFETMVSFRCHDWPTWNLCRPGLALSAFWVLGLKVCTAPPCLLHTWLFKCMLGTKLRPSSRTQWIWSQAHSWRQGVVVKPCIAFSWFVHL